MSATIKLFGKNGEEVIVWNDPADPQHVHYSALGYVSEGKLVKKGKPASDKSEEKEATVSLEKTELMKLSRPDLLQIAVEKEIVVAETMSKSEIVDLLVLKA